MTHSSRSGCHRCSHVIARSYELSHKEAQKTQKAQKAKREKALTTE
jgi:hypothetical protein